MIFSPPLSLGVSTDGNTLGTTGLVAQQYVFVGSNLTLSQSISGQSATVTLSVAAPGAGGGIAAAGSNATYTSGTVLFSGVGGGITVSSNTGQRIDLSVAAQSTQTQGFLNTVSIVGNSAGATSSGSGSLVLGGGPNITLSGSTAAGGMTVSISAAAQSVQTQGLVQSLNGSGTQLSISAGNLISISNNASTINIIDLLSSSAIAQPISSASSAGSLASRFALADHAHAGLNSVSVVGNTSGTVTAGAGSIVLAGGPNITLSGATGGGGMTLSVSAKDYTLSEIDPVPISSLLTNSTLGQNTLYFMPFDLQENVNVYRANFYFSLNTLFSNSNNTRSAGMTFSAAMYSRGTGASTERITTFWSGSFFINFTGSSNTTISITHPIGINNSTSVSTVATAGNISAYLANSVGGFRLIPLPVSLTLTPGRYWMAMAHSTTSANTQALINASIMQQTQALIAFAPMGTSSVASNASVYQLNPGMGTYSATSGAFPGSIALSLSDIRGALTQTIPFFDFSGYTTGTNLL